MSTKKDEPAKNEIREKPRKPSETPRDPSPSGRGGDAISEIYGDVRKGQKVPKLPD
jgi:hypothetical protein